MENYIKNNVSDITYKSELSPFYCKKAGGIKFAQTTYVHYHSVSCGLI